MGARFATTNLLMASTAVVTASSEALGYPDDFARTPARWKKWRSAISTGDQWILFDLGSNQSFRVMSAVSARVHTGGGTLTFQAHTSNSWGSPTFSQVATIPATDFTGVWTYWLPATLSLRWFRFYFTNVGAQSTYVELAVPWVGPYIEPTQSISYGWEIGIIDPSLERRAISGARTVVRRTPYHAITAEFKLQSATARDTLRAEFKNYGRVTPMICAPDPAAPGLNFYGRLEEWQAANMVGAGDRWEMPIQFTEDVP